MRSKGKNGDPRGLQNPYSIHRQMYLDLKNLWWVSMKRGSVLGLCDVCPVWRTKPGTSPPKAGKGNGMNGGFIRTSKTPVDMIHMGFWIDNQGADSFFNHLWGGKNGPRPQGGSPGFPKKSR